ncbi:MAG TPA: class I SAM-dependent methyltransferase [Bacteroidia bacterium]|jgi:cyclopropane fatty-acyl-phospholipid synthase-like methyltransferase|nr:class I SAM-dependent methyltransferase [Bacteroidia bacterium]
MDNLIEIPVNRLIDLCLEVGMVPDQKFHYRWDEYATWQLEGLLQLGMQKTDSLLDIGCGPLRLGVHAINYLNDGNYYGVDATPEYVQLAPLIYKEFGLNKKYHIKLDSDFNFSSFNTTFNFANAQSVFTHLSKDQIVKCLSNLKNVMKKGGIFLFTNIPSSIPRGFLYTGNVPMIAGTHCTIEFYKEIANNLNIEFIEKTITHPTQTAHLFKF